MDNFPAVLFFASNPPTSVFFIEENFTGRHPEVSPPSRPFFTASVPVILSFFYESPFSRYSSLPQTHVFAAIFNPFPLFLMTLFPVPLFWLFLPFTPLPCRPSFWEDPHDSFFSFPELGGLASHRELFPGDFCPILFFFYLPVGAFPRRLNWFSPGILLHPFFSVLCPLTEP